jgi:DNA-binding protein H-NS
MAKGNGRLTAKTVSSWFSVLKFDEQATVLGALQKAHDKVRQDQINTLRRQLQVLENGSSLRATPSIKRGLRKAGAKTKYRDPKTNQSWSGRGRMATWLAEKVKAGEDPKRYLV